MPGSMELRKMRVLVVGLARTGVATALFCAGHNAMVTATETRGEGELGDAPAKLRAAGVTLELGGHTEKTYLAQDLIIPSPGVPADDPFLLLARSKGITVWSEIELAYRFLEGKLIGITGSNGKTTTTTLVHHILKSAAMQAYLAGNVGTPLISDDPASAKYAPKKPQVFWFSRKKHVAQGACLNGDEIVVVHDGKEDAVMRAAEIPLAGAHNLENVLAAVIITRLAGVDAPGIAKAVKSFPGVEHRLEFVADIRGVRYYNDSKATNVDATLKALDAFPGRILVILGGKDKGSDYTVLQKPLRERAILALLIGAAADKIEKQIAGSVAIERAGTIQRAVEAASMAARPGDIVLLAPACASFDQFENYEHRGRVFKQLVRALENHTVHSATGKR